MSVTYRKNYHFALFLAFLVLCPVVLTAQNAQTMSINVSAQVLESIELSTIRNMRLGDVQPGRREIVINPIINSDAGKMVATGIPNARIRVSFLQEWQLANDRNNHNLTFYYEVAGNPIDNQSTAELLGVDNRDLRFNDSGEYYFWIGGRVNVTSAQPGNYQGEFTIEIEYI